MSDLPRADLRWLDSAARYAAVREGAKGKAAALVVDEAEGLVLGRGINGPEKSAEETAIAEAGAAARGATLYVTIDPHPDPVMEAGIGRVVVGVGDPYAMRRRTIAEEFAKAGIEVVTADHEPSARLIEGRTSLALRGRPLVTVRLAVSRDGMIGRRDGSHVEIMGAEARRWALMQRVLHDAVLVGAHTAELDDKRLDEKLDGYDGRRYARIVALGGKTLPPRHFLERSVNVRRTIAIAAEGRGVALPDGVEAMATPGRNGRPDLRKAIPDLGGLHPFDSILVEGGAKLTETMLSSELIDRLYLIECAAEVGRGGLPATPLGGLDGRLRAAGLTEVASEPLGADRLKTFEPAYIAALRRELAVAAKRTEL